MALFNRKNLGVTDGITHIETGFNYIKDGRRVHYFECYANTDNVFDSDESIIAPTEFDGKGICEGSYIYIVNGEKKGACVMFDDDAQEWVEQ